MIVVVARLHELAEVSVWSIVSQAGLHARDFSVALVECVECRLLVLDLVHRATCIFSWVRTLVLSLAGRAIFVDLLVWKFLRSCLLRMQARSQWNIAHRN